MTIKLNSFNDSSKTLIMPNLTSLSSNVSISTNAGNQSVSTWSSFYSAIEVDHTNVGFESATLQPVSNTTEQTILDTGTGKQGVLTSVLSPRSTGVSTMTIRVTIDGDETVFTNSIDLANDSVMILGDTKTWSVPTTNNPVGYNSGAHAGYFTVSSGQDTSLLTPLDTLTLGLDIGMVFEDSLKITVQCDSALTAGSSTHKAIASWLNYIPEGLL